MSEQKSLGRGRTQPRQTDSDDEEDDVQRATDEGSKVEIPPGYRAKVKLTGKQTSQFPSAPLYSIGETVYVLVGEGQLPLGPFLVVSIDSGNRYSLKWQENGAMLQDLVSEDKFVVPG